MRISDGSSDVCSSDLASSAETRSAPSDLRREHAKSPPPQGVGFLRFRSKVLSPAEWLGGVGPQISRTFGTSLAEIARRSLERVGTRFATDLPIGRAACRERVCH